MTCNRHECAGELYVYIDQRRKAKCARRYNVFVRARVQLFVLIIVLNSVRYAYSVLLGKNIYCEKRVNEARREPYEFYDNAEK